MEKINFVNNSEPDISAENLNLLQSNVDNAKVDKQNITVGGEFKTGRTIGGKEEYGKRINIGALPNATTKNVRHGLQNVTFTGYEGITSAGYKLPFTSTSVNYNIQVLAGISDIVIKTVEDYSTQTGFVILYYTKTS